MCEQRGGSWVLCLACQRGCRACRGAGAAARRGRGPRRRQCPPRCCARAVPSRTPAKQKSTGRESRWAEPTGRGAHRRLKMPWGTGVPAGHPGWRHACRAVQPGLCPATTVHLPLPASPPAAPQPQNPTLRMMGTPMRLWLVMALLKRSCTAWFSGSSILQVQAQAPLGEFLGSRTPCCKGPPPARAPQCLSPAGLPWHK